MQHQPQLPAQLFRRADALVKTDGKTPLRVLSLGKIFTRRALISDFPFPDGGGVRGYSTLLILQAVMAKAAPNKKPYEVFDLIGGTSTGG